MHIASKIQPLCTSFLAQKAQGRPLPLLQAVLQGNRRTAEGHQLRRRHQAKCINTTLAKHAILNSRSYCQFRACVPRGTIVSWAIQSRQTLLGCAHKQHTYMHQYTEKRHISESKGARNRTHSFSLARGLMFGQACAQVLASDAFHQLSLEPRLREAQLSQNLVQLGHAERFQVGLRAFCRVTLANSSSPRHSMLYAAIAAQCAVSTTSQCTARRALVLRA